MNGCKCIYLDPTMWCLGRTRLAVQPHNKTVNPFNLFASEEVLCCNATSDPSTRPVTTWYRLINGTVTRVNTSSSDRLVENNGLLIFRGVAKTEWSQLMGWYRCVVDNGYTSDSANLFVDVLTSPIVPTRCEFPASVFYL